MGGVVKGAFNVVKSVVKYGINMVKSVIKNPLPTIATIALGYFAPGFAQFSGLTKTFGKVAGELIVNSVGRAAISAATGGKLSSIVAAGITPFFNSPIFTDLVGGLGGGVVGESLKKVTEFVSKPLTAVFGEQWGNIFTGALGDSSVAGLVAAVSGEDIISAMGSELVSSAVGKGIAKSWDALKTEVPKLLQSEVDIDQKLLDAKVMKDTTPVIGKVQSLQYSINKNITEANSLIEEYNKIDEVATIARNNLNYYADLANNATSQEDFDFNEQQYKKYEAEYIDYIPKLDNIANTINQLYVPSINEEKAILEAEYNNPESKALIDDYISKIDEVGQLSKSYELGVGKVLAENNDFKMVNAIAQGNFTEASKFYNELENVNKSLLEIDPNAIIVSPSIDVSAQALLKDIYSTSDETLKNQLIAQANLNQQFNDIRANAPVLPTPTVPETSTPTEPTVPETPTPVEPTIPETPAPVEPTPTQPTIPETPAPVQPTPVTPVVPETPITDDRAPGYADLPTLPEGGIGQPTPSVPTAPTTPTNTPPSGTGSNIVNNIIGGAGNMLENALIGGATNAVVNEILGNEPPKRPTINKPRPPAKADVGTLRPYTGSLFGESTTTPTTPVGGLPTTPPAKVDPSSLTPYTGSLSFLGQTTTTPTPPTNTTTQTPSGGLQSNQTQTPPTKVDVSRLTPVTDTNLLKSLGIA
jgi:predicted translin family RNA/ssDNA-binding protein